MIRREDRRAVLAENLPPGLLDNPWRYPVALQLLAIVAKLLAEQCADDSQALACNVNALQKVIRPILEFCSRQPRCHNCVYYPRGRAGKGGCTLIVKIVRGSNQDRACFRPRMPMEWRKS